MSGLRVLIFHNLYQQRGGEDLVVEQEVKLLKDAGYVVRLELVSNDDIKTVLDKMRYFISAPFNFGAKEYVSNLVREFKPDIVHVHNFFPLLSPSLHYYLAKMGVPIVQTIHNYRLMCSSGTFLRAGSVCELCIDSKVNAVRYGCYRGSSIASMAVVGMQKSFIIRENLFPGSVIYIALTNFAKAKLMQGGIDGNQIEVKPNFLERNETFFPIWEERLRQALFVGRLSEEKGAEFLISTWEKIPDIPLVVAGDGPMRAYLEKIAPPNVSFLGKLPANEVSKLMAQSSVLIFPSLWYEGFPMTILEAFRLGLPVIASELGSMSEIIEPGYNGMLFPPGDEDKLCDAVASFFSSDEVSLSRGAQDSYSRNYTPEMNLVILKRIYERALGPKVNIEGSV